MRSLTTLALLALLIVAVAASPAAAADYEGAIDISFPVAGEVHYTDSFDAGRSGGRVHKATDIMVERHGQPVHAAVGGEITFITGVNDDPPSYGYMLRVRGDDGRTYEYIHLGRQNGPASEAYAKGLQEGSRVERGQHLGSAGSSGNASRSAPHLHFAIRDPGVTDPYGTNYRNPYRSLRRAEDGGGVGTLSDPAPEPAVLAGDFDGDGRATPVRYHDGEFRLCEGDNASCDDVRTVHFGSNGDVAVVGDWNGDGVDGIGVVRGEDWYLRDTATAGRAERVFAFGRAGDEPIAGDWNGDGTTTPGLRRDGRWFLRTRPGGGRAQIDVNFGRAADEAVVGDWDGDGDETIGVVRGKEWHLNDRNGGGKADYSFRYGAPRGDDPVSGDWQGDGRDGIGVVRSDAWHLRSTPDGGSATMSLDF